jgi:pilus assembly protein CpaF
VFAVIISEKGGAERRESFDRPEITVGRTQGNDLMLPKGNVSKRHAKLALKDSHCIVTDLNSTNGTYVNRRRIAQPTDVRDGDRIYIGDFILRVEVDPSATSDHATPPDQVPIPSAPARATVSSAERGVPDDTGYSIPAVPRPPRLPSGTREPGQSLPARPPRPQLPRPALPTPSDSRAGAPRRAEASQPEIDVVAYIGALGALVERVAGSLGPLAEQSDADLSTRVTASIGPALGALRAEGKLPAGLPVQRLVADAERELVEVGPLGTLWSDDSVAAVVALSFDRVMALRGDELTPIEPAFSSESSLQRAVRRLCARSGVPLREGERVVDRTLEGGIALTVALQPVAARGSVVVVRRAQQGRRTLKDLVRFRGASPEMAGFLEQCVAARANMLVVGPRDAGTSEVVGALAEASTSGHQVVVQRSMALPVAAGATLLGPVSADAADARLVDLAARLPDPRLVVELATPHLTLGLTESLGAGVQGIIAVAYGATVERTLDRLSADLVSLRPGLPGGAAREWLAASLDIAVEVARGVDGVLRLRRIVELLPLSSTGTALTQEIFRYAEGGGAQADGGSFVALGVVPRIADQLRARGAALDPSAFQRPPER